MAAREGTQQATVHGARRLGWLTLLCAPALAAGSVFALTGAGVPCPFLLSTGWLCPVCGASRMGSALLIGDVASAWRWNPFILVVFFLASAVWLWTAVRVATGRAAGLPGPLALFDRMRMETVLGLILVPALIFLVARNLV